MATNDSPTLKTILSKYKNANYYQLKILLIDYLKRTEEYHLTGNQQTIEDLNRLEFFLLDNFSEDELDVLFNSVNTRFMENKHPVKTDILYDIYFNLQVIFQKSNDDFYFGNHNLFSDFRISNNRVIIRITYDSLIPDIPGKPHIQQLYEGVDCRALYDKMLNDLSHDNKAKYRTKAILNDFNANIQPYIFLMDKEKREDYFSCFMEQISKASNGLEQAKESEIPITLIPSLNDEVPLADQYSYAEFIQELPELLALIDYSEEKKEKILSKYNSSELKEDWVDLWNTLRLIKFMEVDHPLYEKAFRSYVMNLPIFNHEKMDQSRRIIEEYLPHFHEIYLKHYQAPYRFTNSFLKSIISPPQPSGVSKEPLPNNIFALYLYLAYKKHDELSNVKNDATETWRIALAKEMINGIKGHNYIRLKEVYKSLTQHYEFKESANTTKTFEIYLRDGHLFGLIKKANDKKSTKDILKTLCKTLSQLQKISTKHPKLNIDELLDEWEKDINEVSSDNKQKWRENIFDELA